MPTERVRSVADLAVRVARDPQLANAIRENPAAAIAGIAEPLLTDVWIYRIVVGTLGLAVVGAIAGGIILAVQEKTVPDLLVAIGSAAVGALAGLLAPSPRS
jgi:hypothetical protein